MGRQQSARELERRLPKQGAIKEALEGRLQQKDFMTNPEKSWR